MKIREDKWKNKGKITILLLSSFLLFSNIVVFSSVIFRLLAVIFSFIFQSFFSVVLLLLVQICIMYKKGTIMKIIMREKMKD